MTAPPPQVRWDGIKPLFSYPMGTHVRDPAGGCRVITNAALTKCQVPEHAAVTR